MKILFLFIGTIFILSACSPLTTTGAGVSSSFDATTDTSKSSSGGKVKEKSWTYEESAS